MTSTDPIQQLHTLIDEGVELLSALEKLLADERRAVEKRDRLALEQSTTEKTALLPRVEANFRARQQWMSAQGIEPSADGWQAFVEQQPAQSARPLNDAWQQLSDALERTQKASRVNQQLIRRSQENTTRLLSLLQGKNPQNDLYGSSGQSASISTQSPIGKA